MCVCVCIQDDPSSRSFLLQHLRGEDHVVVVMVQAGLGFHAESTCVAAWYASLSLSLSLLSPATPPPPPLRVGVTTAFAFRNETTAAGWRPAWCAHGVHRLRSDI